MTRMLAVLLVVAMLPLAGCASSAPATAPSARAVEPVQRVAIVPTGESKFTISTDGVGQPGMPIDGGGEVTSGSHSPMLEVGIGMGYVPAPQARPGTELTVDVRGRSRRARVVKKPIYKREG